MTRGAHRPPPVWTTDRLEADRRAALHVFRAERMREPLQKYLDAFAAHREVFDELLTATADLTAIAERAILVLATDGLLEALRYLPGPSISLDDLKVIAETPSVTGKAVHADPQIATRIVETIMLGLDRVRFPWVADKRSPTAEERASAILASAALLASKRVETARRNEGKEAQEQRVREVLDRGAIAAHARVWDRAGRLVASSGTQLLCMPPPKRG